MSRNNIKISFSQSVEQAHNNEVTVYLDEIIEVGIKYLKNIMPDEKMLHILDTFLPFTVEDLADRIKHIQKETLRAKLQRMIWEYAGTNNIKADPMKELQIDKDDLINTIKGKMN